MERKGSLCQSADLVVCKAFLGFEPVPNSIVVGGKVLLLATIEIWIASVIEFLVEKECSRGRRQNGYTEAFTKFLLMATDQFIESVCQLTQYWHSEKLEVVIKTESIEARSSIVFRKSRTAAKVAALPSVSK